VWFVILRTATGGHEPMPIPPELEGDTAVESAANLLRKIADEQKKLPDRIRAFKPPVTITIEEVPEPAEVAP
jgi:hypothetical protein